MLLLRIAFQCQTSRYLCFNGTYILFSCALGGVICKDARESVWSWTNIMVIYNRPGPHQKKGIISLFSRNGYLQIFTSSCVFQGLLHFSICWNKGEESHRGFLFILSHRLLGQHANPVSLCTSCLSHPQAIQDITACWPIMQGIQQERFLD